MELSIIIVSYNTRELLRQCLGTVYRTTSGLEFEVIIVDNGSTDESIRMVKENFAEVILIQNNQNVGFAKANNQAICISQGEFLLLLNSDAVLHENTVDILVKHLRTHSDGAAVGPKVTFPGGRLQSKGEQFPYLGKSVLDLFRIQRILADETLWRLFPKYFWDDSVSRPVDWVIGCCLMLRRDAVDRVGLLSEKFFFYGEEAEWCYRAKKAGHEIWYVADANVTHYNEGSFAENRTELRAMGTAFFYKETRKTFVGIVITVSSIVFASSRWISFCVSQRRRSSNSRDYWRYVRQDLAWHVNVLKLLFFS